jgi:glycosyltransferase involved in cell wall biosynthesis
LNVVFLSHYFPPEVGAPQTRIAELAAGLRARGASVTVHTGFPHYPDGRVQAPYRIRPVQREVRPDGVHVVRSAVYPAPNRGFARRLAGHLSLSASAVATAALSGAADVVVVESPPLFLGGAAIAYAAAKQARLVVHVADLWPASAVALGALSNPRAIALAERLESAVYARADAIVVPTEGMEEALAAHPAARGKVARIGPTVDTRRFSAIPAPNGAGPLRVLYAGTVGMAQGLDTLVAAAERAGPETVRVTVAGGGAELEGLRGRLAADAIANVELLGTVPAAAVPGLYGEAHTGVVLLRDRPLFEGALPTKLLECMAAGRPVVLSARGEAARLVTGTGAGIVVEPERPRELARAFETLARDPARRAQLGGQARAAARRFDRAVAVDRWAALLERAAAQRARR